MYRSLTNTSSSWTVKRRSKSCVLGVGRDRLCIAPSLEDPSFASPGAASRSHALRLELRRSTWCSRALEYLQPCGESETPRCSRSTTPSPTRRLEREKQRARVGIRVAFRSNWRMRLWGRAIEHSRIALLPEPFMHDEIEPQELWCYRGGARPSSASTRRAAGLCSRSWVVGRLHVALNADAGHHGR